MQIEDATSTLTREDKRKILEDELRKISADSSVSISGLGYKITHKKYDFFVDKDLKKKDSYIEYFRNKVLFLEEKDKFYHRLFLDILILIYQELLNRISLHEAKYFDDILDNVKIQEIDKKEMIRKLELLNLYQERFNYHINLDLQYTSLFSKL